MAISDRLLGKKNINGKPHIETVQPGAALPGGEVRILGKGLRPPELRRPRVQFGDVEGAVLISSDDFLVARVPEGATSGPVVVATNGHVSNPHQVKVAIPIAENLHPVTNPALDAEGNIYATFSGTRGQKVPVAIFRIDTNYSLKPFLPEMMNATSIAFDREGQMYVSSRHDGTVYRIAPNGTMSAYAEGMGVATGIAFDREQNLYVGDRSGTVFKISRDRQIFVFATLEPSVSAYHLAFGPKGDLFVTGPTTSSFDSVYKIDPHGSVSIFYRGLGRPQGLAFDVAGNMYVAASLGGKRGIVKITPDAKPSLEVAGHGLVGLAFAPGRAAVLATTNAVHRLAWDIQGLSLLRD
ncbi:MAG: gluconolaconase [Acidobacteria bacterium]|nr:MAG: gluconolaconase [Acidobacteriota bacterium]PYY08270.1 MAG: gluconolaconase [Acidobacteriota bacterium]